MSMELRAEPYTLRTRPDIQACEQALRSNLNLGWCNGILFNVLAFKKMANKVEYDAILWNDEVMLFIEYKNSMSMYKSMQASIAKKKKGYAKNIARAFGFLRYNFIIVVNGIEQRAEKGTAMVIPLAELKQFNPEFEFSIEELDYLDKLLNKYEHSQPTREVVLKELRTLRDKIQVNR